MSNMYSRRHSNAKTTAEARGVGYCRPLASISQVEMLFDGDGDREKCGEERARLTTASLLLRYVCCGDRLLVGRCNRLQEPSLQGIYLQERLHDIEYLQGSFFAQADSWC